MVVKQLVARPTRPTDPPQPGQLRPAASKCRLSRDKRKGVFPCSRELLSGPHVQRRKRCDIQNERRKLRRPFWHWRSWSDGQPVQRWPRLRLRIRQNNWTGWSLG